MICMLPAEAFGETVYKTFCYDRQLNKKMKGQIGSSKEVIIKADHAQFAQMIIAAENRTLEMNDVLNHPLGPRPWALDTADGLLRRTSESSLDKEPARRI